jgi:hypothetical protein
MFPITTLIGRLVVLGVAVLALVGFLIWSRRTRSRSFFLGVLAGTGLLLSFDIIWVHTLFGLHHLTNAPEDACPSRCLCSSVSSSSGPESHRSDGRNAPESRPAGTKTRSPTSL